MDNLKNIKAIFVDLDGTLLVEAGKISEKVSRSFLRARDAGIVTIVCTGRCAGESDFAIKAVGADRYLITMNGLEVYEDYKNRKLLYEKRLELDAAVKFTRFIEEKYPMYIQAYIGEHAYNSKRTVPYFQTSGMPRPAIDFFTSMMYVVDDLAEYMVDTNRAANKFLIGTEDHALLKKIRSEINEMFPELDTLSSQPYFLEVLPKNVDKAWGVKMVRDHLGITKEECLIIGDSENDLGMFEEGGICVAMGNAYDEVKKKADIVAPPNTEDGAGWTVDLVVLNRR